MYSALGEFVLGDPVPVTVLGEPDLGDPFLDVTRGEETGGIHVLHAFW